MTAHDLAVFAKAYLVCALWSSVQCDEEGTNCVPLDDLYDTDDIAITARIEQMDECTAFCLANLDDLTTAVSSPAYTWEQAGHDFWLTRCGHGAGFWDRGLGDVGDRLSEAASLCGNIDPYIGDDGLVYFS